MSPVSFAIGVVVALLVSTTVSFAAQAIGRALGLVDIPEDNGLKVHTEAAVPLGGLGVAAGAYIGLLSTGSLPAGFLLASLLMWLVGLVDDFRGLDPLTRLVAAAGSALVMVAFGLVPWAWLPVTAALLVVIGAVNAVNLLDGLDALAGSVTAVSLAGLAAMALVRDMPLEAALSVVACSAVIGFLFWNLPPARLFLGDNGAYFIGIVLAWVALSLAEDWHGGAVAVAAIGVPFLDLGVTVIRRMKTGVRMFGGDRDHTYDRLHKRGWSPGKVAVWFSAVQALWSSLVVATAATVGDGIALLVALPLAFGVVVVIGLRDWSHRT